MNKIEIFKIFGKILIDNREAKNSLSETDDKAKGVGGSIGSVITGVLKFAAGIATAAAAGAAALYKLAMSSAETLDRVDKLSQKIGISYESFQEWDYIMSQSGMDIEKMQVGLKTLTAQMDMAANGSASAQANFAALGLTWEDGNGKLKSQEQMMEEAIMALAAMEDQTEKARLATLLFGKSGVEMLPMLNGGIESIEELRAQAHALGLVMDDEAVLAGVLLGDTIDDVKKSFGAAVTMIGIQFMPAVQKAADWLLSFMPVIQTVLQSLFTFIGNGVGFVIDFIVTIKDAITEWAEANGESIEAFKNVLGEIITFVGTVIETLFAFISGFFSWFKSSREESDANLLSGITAALQFVLAFLQGFFDRCVTFWDTYGETIIAIITPIWEAIQIIFNTALDVIQNIFSIFAGIFAGDWSAVWEGVKNILSTVWDGIVLLIPKLLEALFEALKGGLTALYNIGEDLFNSVWDGLKSIWTGIVDWVTEKVTWLTDKLAFWRSGQSEMRGGGNADGGHATGLDYVPYDGYRAILHRGERVLTAEEAAEHNNGGGDTYNTYVTLEAGEKPSPAETANEVYNIMRRLAEGF